MGYEYPNGLSGITPKSYKHIKPKWKCKKDGDSKCTYECSHRDKCKLYEPE